MGELLRIGVVGAGVFGGHHAAKCMAHPRVLLSGIHDADAARARALAEKLSGQPGTGTRDRGTRGLEALGLEALVERSDAVIVACPASGHAATALVALARARHTMVEKPLADGVAQGEAMVAAARAAGAVLQVGHQERFVAEAIGLHRVPEVPLRIRAWRDTLPGPRGRDVGVELDLMTHDIDLVLWLVGGEPRIVERTLHPGPDGRGDRAELCLRFEHTEVRLEASRIARMPRRVMELDYPSGRVRVDFNAKTLVHDTPFALDAAFGNAPQARDSLGAALDAFVRAVLDGARVPVTGQDGLRAMRLALGECGGTVRRKT